MTDARPSTDIPGYNPGSPDVARSPITMREWEELKLSAFFSDEDVIYLRLSYDVLKDQVADLLKVWRGIIFLHPHLRACDENPQTGEVDTAYAKAVGLRLVNGSSTRRRRITTKRGSTISTRSACDTTGARRARPTTVTLSATSVPATSSPSAPPSSPL